MKLLATAATIASLAIVTVLCAGDVPAAPSAHWVVTDVLRLARHRFPAYAGISLVGMTNDDRVLWTAYELGGDQGIRDLFEWQNGRITDLGTLPKDMRPSGFDNEGEVVGTDFLAAALRVPGSGPSAPIHAYLWHDGRATALGTLGVAGSVAGIDDTGQIAMTRVTAFSVRALVWERGVVTDLGSLRGGATSAAAINRRGQIVGDSLIRRGEVHGFLWQRGKMTDLGGVPGASYQAVAINDRGQVVGRWAPSGHSNLSRGFLWERGKLTDLAPVSTEFVAPIAINDLGQVILTRGTSTRSRGILWKHGTTTDVGSLGGRNTHPLAINDRGQIVGTSDLRDSTSARPDVRAFLWQNGTLTRLPGPGITGGEMEIDPAGTHIVLGAYSCCPGQLLLWTYRR